MAIGVSGASPYEGQTIDAARRHLTRALNDSGSETAQVDARILTGEATQLSAADLIANGNLALTVQQSSALTGLAARRVLGEPISQILGYRDFWKDRFTVTPDVLTPRPETEGIIEAALSRFDAQAVISILDLGTGSGAIILSLLGEFENAQGKATDISQAALKIARSNAGRLGKNCAFIQSDWFESIDGVFDLIVSNPPYITDAEMGELSKDVAQFEPDLALCGGPDGLEPYRIIISNLHKYLKPKGWVILEIGALQGPDVASLLSAHGLRDVTVICDLAGHDRIVAGRALP